MQFLLGAEIVRLLKVPKKGGYVMSLRQTFLMASITILIVVIGYSSYQLWYIYSHRASEQELHYQLLAYRPTPPEQQSTTPQTTTAPRWSWQALTHEPQIVNQSIIDLQEIHASVVGWVHIPNTNIDHPFVQGRDNRFYLHRDINHNHSPAGTVFMDNRNSYDFSDFHTLIYGHNMRNGSMFSSLQEFNNREFFDENTTGYIFLPYHTYIVEWFAFANIRPDDAVVYGLNFQGLQCQVDFLAYVRRNSQHHRDIEMSALDRFVTLSTCRNDSANSRLILMGVLR